MDNNGWGKLTEGLLQRNCTRGRGKPKRRWRDGIEEEIGKARMRKSRVEGSGERTSSQVVEAICR
jgi:hypothetical protein